MLTAQRDKSWLCRRWNGQKHRDNQMSKKSEVAFCGLCCGDCIIRNGRLSVLSQELLSKMRTPEFEKLAEGLSQLDPDQFKQLGNHYSCHGILETMDHLDCDKICKDGGGSTNCKIRECCQEKGFEGCWLCDTFESCQILGWLDPVHKNANIQNIRLIRKNGIDEFLNGPKYW